MMSSVFHHLAILSLISTLVAAIQAESSTSDIEDECIWEDRTYNGNQPPSVMNAKATCNKGKIIWQHPYGGLRASFHPGRHIKGAFKLCFTCKNPGITIFREGVNTMTLLKKGHDSKSKDRYCLHSTKKHIVLYMEASRQGENIMIVDYNIKPLKKKFLHKNKACRPCRYDKLFEAICKGDFALTGYINSSALIPNTKLKHIEFIGENLLHQTTQIFTKPTPDASFLKGHVKFPAGCGGKGKRHRLLIAGKGTEVTCFTNENQVIRMVDKYYDHLCMQS